MNLLAIDTSTDLASVAIAVHDNIYSEEQSGLRQHAQLLLPMIEGILLRAGLTFSQLDAIAFGRGPGSFTGLRIACSVAKGLAYAHDLPLYPVSSLATIANEVYETDQGNGLGYHVLTMIDARMHQVYWGYFTGESFDVDEQVTSAGDISLPSASPLILAGVGFETYALQLPETIQGAIGKQCTVFPKAAAMIRLVQSGRIRAVSAAEALPVYVRNQVTQGGDSRG